MTVMGKVILSPRVSDGSYLCHLKDVCHLDVCEDHIMTYDYWFLKNRPEQKQHIKIHFGLQPVTLLNQKTTTKPRYGTEIFT